MRQRSIPLALTLVAATALLIVVVVAVASSSQPSAPSPSPTQVAASAPPTFGASTPPASPSPTATPTPSATVAAPAPPRARWVLSGSTLFVQPDAPDGTRTAATEARVVSASGFLQSQATIDLALAGEPVTCGSPSVVLPLVSALVLPPDVRADFAQVGGPRTYRVEVRAGPSSSWQAVTLLDARAIGGSTCPAPDADGAHAGAQFYFPPGVIDFCGMFISYQAPTATTLGMLRLGGTTFIPAPPLTTPYVQTVTATPGTWSCVRGTVVNSETVPNELTDFQLVTAPDQLATVSNAVACGIVTDFFLGDLPSGGGITLSGTYFDVGGARVAADVVDLSVSNKLRIGMEACILKATFTERDPRRAYVKGGRLELR